MKNRPEVYEHAIVALDSLACDYNNMLEYDIEITMIIVFFCFPVVKNENENKTYQAVFYKSALAQLVPFCPHRVPSCFCLHLMVTVSLSTSASNVYIVTVSLYQCISVSRQ